MKRNFLKISLITQVLVSTCFIVACSNGKIFDFKKSSFKKTSDIKSNSKKPKILKPTKLIKNTMSIDQIFNQFNKVNANPDFVDGAIFSKSPRSVKNKDLTINNLGLKEIYEKLELIGAKIENIRVIDSTRNDSTGKMDIELSIKHSNKIKKHIVTVSGLLITKDVELNADGFTTIKQIILAINNKTSLGFEKNISKMSPQNLKDELVDLQKKLCGGSVTVIGHYKGKTEAVAFQKRRTLTNLINSFGDVSHTKKLEGWLGTISLKAGLNIMAAIGGDIFKLFADYGTDVIATHSTVPVANLIGSLPKEVISMFPDLLNMFQTVANMVKKMDIVKEWAKDHNKTKNLKDIDHQLVRFVLQSGK
ncbi:MAG: hypothetical protein GY679_05095 [Mycoplasma sp.]|nr:hypothetical protein [Mycoplasma sp.]